MTYDCQQVNMCFNLSSVLNPNYGFIINQINVIQICNYKLHYEALHLKFLKKHYCNPFKIIICFVSFIKYISKI